MSHSNKGMEITRMIVITYEQAKQQGVGPRSLDAISEWHKNQAGIAKGPDKERHFKIAADLRRVANQLRVNK
jgi:hypothetical protein